jgi:hypothetical protein
LDSTERVGSVVPCELKGQRVEVVRKEKRRGTRLTFAAAQPVPRAVAVKKEGATSIAAPEVTLASRVPPNAVATAP